MAPMTAVLRHILLPALVALTFTAGPAAAGSYSFVTIDDPLSAPGKTYVSGINNDGTPSGGYTAAAGDFHGFIESGGVFTAIDDPNAPIGGVHAAGGTSTTGISNAGVVA